jgi:hypothetical protein
VLPETDEQAKDYNPSRQKCSSGRKRKLKVYELLETLL